MDGSQHNGRKKISGNVILLTVLIGFCILAIIEIAYGQAQIRMERERLALQEANNQAVQELREEWDGLKGEPEGGAESAKRTGGEQSGGTVTEVEKMLLNTRSESDADAADAPSAISENSSEDEGDYAMQIVFMGDSILDNNREQAGVASLIGDACNARVYNMAIGGTTAAVPYDEPRGFDDWESLGLMGIVNAIVGNIDASLFDGYQAGEILKSCDFYKTDYFIIEYGINDCMSGKIPQSKYMADGTVADIADIATYAGALESATTLLRSHFPDAKIIIVSPHYCQFFEDDKYMGDSYSLNYGYGTLVEFFRVSAYVADQHREDDVMFFNAMDETGIDAYTAEEYLEDGIHLSEQGRRLYAECLSRRIRADFYPEE